MRNLRVNRRELKLRREEKEGHNNNKRVKKQKLLHQVSSLVIGMIGRMLTTLKSRGQHYKNLVKSKKKLNKLMVQRKRRRKVKRRKTSLGFLLEMHLGWMRMKIASSLVEDQMLVVWNMMMTKVDMKSKRSLI